MTFWFGVLGTLSSLFLFSFLATVRFSPDPSNKELSQNDEFLALSSQMSLRTLALFSQGAIGRQWLIGPESYIGVRQDSDHFVIRIT